MKEGILKIRPSIPALSQGWERFISLYLLYFKISNFPFSWNHCSSPREPDLKVRRGWWRRAHSDHIRAPPGTVLLRRSYRDITSVAQSEERTDYFSLRWEWVGAGHLMPLRHLTSCCAHLSPEASSGAPRKAVYYGLLKNSLWFWTWWHLRWYVPGGFHGYGCTL